MTSEKYLVRFVLSGALAAGLFFAAGKPALADKDWGPWLPRADRERSSEDGSRYRPSRPKQPRSKPRFGQA